MNEASPDLIYQKLRAHFGFLDWWPGETRFEIFVGAILTQQTTWKNVEKALANLKSDKSLSIEKIADMKLQRLQRLIRPSGFYRQKAKRLKNICKSIVKDYDSFDELLKIDANGLRKVLLSYNGIGEETADSIILYASNKPIFVIDAYTRRAMSRINPAISKKIEYEELRSYFESRIRKDARIYKDFHAQFVELGKNYCKTRPLCNNCPLNKICSHGIKNSQNLN